MEIMNILNLMADASALCGQLGPILRVVGYVVFAIRIGVPIVLIIMGMLGFAKAMSEKDEGKMKEAQKLLVKRVIYAVAVFFVVPIVNLLMSVIVQDENYKACTKCVFRPTECSASSFDGGL